MRTFLLLTAWVCLLPGWASAADIASLAAGLDSERFGDRERAEKELLQAGLAIIDQALDSSVLPNGATDADVERHFARLTEGLQSALKEKLYVHLDRLEGLEPRFRAASVRRAVEQHAEHRFSKTQEGFSRRLPPAEAEKVYGYTGGFREGTTWFDTKFGNNSIYTVTSIRILVRLTNKRTGKQTEKQATLGSDQAPLQLGQTVNWSVDIGIKRTNEDEFFWDTLGAYGTGPHGPESLPPD